MQWVSLTVGPHGRANFDSFLSRGIQTMYDAQAEGAATGA